MSRVHHTHYIQKSDLEFVLEIFQKQSDRFSCCKYFVYGGAVRDTIRGVPFQDIDVGVSCPELANSCPELAKAFIQSLEQSSRMIHLQTRTTKDHPEFSLEYQCFSMTIQTPKTAEVKIDISYSMAQSLEEDSLNNCDFTANNLIIDRDGNISTRIKAYQIGIKKFSHAEWTAKCIRDCVEGKLVWMIPDRFTQSMGATEATQNAFMEKMNMRLEKMLSKGFVLTGEHLTSFRLMKMRPF